MKRILILTLVAGTLAAAAATAAGPLFSEDADVLPSMRQGELVRPDTMPANIAERFGAFRADAAQTDALTPTARAALGRSAGEFQGANLDLSRRLSAGSGRALYAVPADDALCWAVVEERVGAASTCQPIAQAAAGEAYNIASGGFGLADDRVLVSGLMPDGVESVTVVDRSGAETTVAVERNAYVVETGAPARLMWKLGAVERSLDIGS